MAKLTILQIVQDMLSAIEAASVTTMVSGSTTADALLCVNIANRTFENTITRSKWKHIRTYKALIAGANLNELKADTNDLYIDSKHLWYGELNNEQRMHYIDPEEFVRRTINRTSTDTDVTVINNIKVINNRAPSYFTTFDDETLVFEAMPSAAGLVAGDSKALVYVEPTTRLTLDANTYDLPKQLFPAFRDLCIAYAVIELADDEQRGLRLKREAENRIAKLANSGQLVERDDNAYKVIAVRGIGRTSRSRLTL